MNAPAKCFSRVRRPVPRQSGDCAGRPARLMCADALLPSASHAARMTSLPIAATPRHRLALQIALLLVAVLAVYQPAFHGGWLWDDNFDLLENPLLRDLPGLAKIWF